MIVFLIIYILGALATLVLMYLIKRKGTFGNIVEITLVDVFIGLMASLLSWISFTVLVSEEYGDIVLFRINKNKEKS